MHLILFGFLLGLGAAIPIGPINLEMIRRNLRFGTPYGVALGLGACFADLTYLIILCLGALTLFQYSFCLRGIGIVGSCVLAWFGLSAFRQKSVEKQKQLNKPSMLRFYLEGYSITLINPYTILFWASVSAQITLQAASNNRAVIFAGIGVMLATVGWTLLLNFLLHFTRHKLSENAIKWLNYAGGVMLLGFAAAGIISAIIK